MFQRISYFIQRRNCSNIGIFVHLKIGNYLLFFLITIRSTDTFASSNNAKFGIVKAVILSGI